MFHYARLFEAVPEQILFIQLHGTIQVKRSFEQSAASNLPLAEICPLLLKAQLSKAHLYPPNSVIAGEEQRAAY
jgi:hypothetical protein